MDRLHAAQQDAVQPVIVQRVVAAGQLVLIDKGVERVRREGVHLPCQRHRRQVAVHVAHVEAVGGPAVVGGKGDEIPEVVVLKVEAGKGQAAELPAGSQLLPGRVCQLGGVLVISGIVVGGVTLGKLGTQAKALGGGADSQQHSGRGTVPEPQHQPAGRHGQQHAGQPGQPGAAGEHGPEIHQHLRDGHGKQRAAPEGDGVAHRGDGVQHQQHNSGNHNMGMAAEELRRFFALYQQTGQCQHDGRGGAQARVHFLFPAGTQARHKQVGQVGTAQIAVGVARKVGGKGSQHKQFGQRHGAKADDGQHNGGGAALFQPALHTGGHQHHTHHGQIIQMDARTQQPQHTPPQAEFSGGRPIFGLLGTQPHPQGQQHQPVGGQRRVGKHADVQRREQHQHPGAQYAGPVFCGILRAHAADAGNERLGQTALHGIAEQPPQP